MKFLVFCFSALLLSSCSLKNVDNNEVSGNVLASDVVAEVNGEVIKASELEQSVSQQVFDELNRIYQIKSIALDYLINEKIIEQEAKRNNMSIDDYLHTYYDTIISESNIDSLLYSNGVNTSVVKGKSMKYLDNRSHEGRIELRNRLELSLKNKLIDSLKTNSYETIKYIYPPKSSNFDLSNLPIYYRGNKESNVSMIIVSDYECDRCIYSHKTYNDIYEKYKGKVKFGSINFSSTPTLASLAADAANKQGKYWEFSDSLFEKNGAIDSLEIYNIANELNIDMVKFDKDIHEQSTLETLSTANDELVRIGLFATPTIIINGRLIYDSNSIKEITHLLEEELNK